uniref:Ubiquitin-like domain-containing protein n=1 Tax=Oryza glumipatula TaxID=40148 RepID=A0A0E0A535_9ORYZ
MDVNVVVLPTVVSRSCRLTVVVEPFDKVVEIKQKVESCYGIPVTAQRLLYWNRELADDHDIEYYPIFDGSHVLLLLHWQVAARFCWIHGLAKWSGGDTTHDMVHVTAYLPPASWGRKVTVFARREESVAALKRRIHGVQKMAMPLPKCMWLGVNDFVCGGLMVMMDHWPLGAYVEFDSGVVEVTIVDCNKMVEAGSSSGSNRNTNVDANDNKIVIGLLMEGSRSQHMDFLLEASPADMVATLREQLNDNFEGSPEMPLLAEGDYHFELNGVAMNEELSLEAHGVVESGETIMIIFGRLPAPGRE